MPQVGPVLRKNSLEGAKQWGGVSEIKTGGVTGQVTVPE